MADFEPRRPYLSYTTENLDLELIRRISGREVEIDGQKIPVTSVNFAYSRSAEGQTRTPVQIAFEAQGEQNAYTVQLTTKGGKVYTKSRSGISSTANIFNNQTLRQVLDAIVLDCRRSRANNQKPQVAATA